MLSKWRKQVRDEELVGDPPPLVPQEAAELQRLREVETQRRRLGDYLAGTKVVQVGPRQ